MLRSMQGVKVDLGHVESRDGIGMTGAEIIGMRKAGMMWTKMGIGDGEGVKLLGVGRMRSVTMVWSWINLESVVDGVDFDWDVKVAEERVAMKITPMMTPRTMRRPSGELMTKICLRCHHYYERTLPDGSRLVLIVCSAPIAVIKAPCP